MRINEYENHEIQTFLKDFKSEMSSLLVTFFNKEEERMKKAEMRQEEMLNETNETIKQLKTTIQKLGNIMIDISKNTNGDQSANGSGETRSVSDNNITRLLETFNGAMESSAKMLCEYNSQIMEHQSDEINKYINSFSVTMANKIDAVFAKYADSINKSTEDIVSSLADKLKESRIESDKMNSEAYKKCLEDVQKENNLELFSLAESLKKLSETNIEFSEVCTENNVNVNQKLDQLIKQNSDFVDSLRYCSEENNNRIKTVISSEVEKMIEKLDSLEEKNAKNYNDSMNDYRDKFVEANAVSLAAVQKDLNNIVTINQIQIKKLTEKIEVVLVENNKISDLINKCTSGYKETLQIISENYRRQNDLSQKDIELLERVMKKNGV